jgi:hypothetical protein
VLPRRSTECNSALAYGLSSRINPKISSYQFRIGSLLVPQKQVNLKNFTGGYAEGFMEWQRAWHATSHAEYAGSCGSICYNVCDIADTTVGDGAGMTTATNFNTVAGPSAVADSNNHGFAIAQELEVFACKNNTIMQGVNTLGAQCFFEFNVDASVSASYIFDYYAYFDCVFVIQDGLISVKF